MCLPSINSVSDGLCPILGQYRTKMDLNQNWPTLELKWIEIAFHSKSNKSTFKSRRSFIRKDQRILFVSTRFEFQILRIGFPGQLVKELYNEIQNYSLRKNLHREIVLFTFWVTYWILGKILFSTDSPMNLEHFDSNLLGGANCEEICS